MSIDATGLPSELLVSPQPLIGFCGLEISQNVLHKSIWDAFSTNRKADRAAVSYKLLPPNYDFPVAKAKRAPYEWYQSKGILKRNWMLKHLHVLPAVVVVFQEMEWNDAQWSEKQLICVSVLQSLRSALQDRNTRMCLVLLQRAAPLPPGEDLLASERAASLATACGINSDMLFILPHTEHLTGYTLRLESAFLDMAQRYYALMAKRIRAHRDQLTAAHTNLKIRHQFKLGFVGEMRQDFSTALKHYTQSYANLDEIRMNDGNCLEIKTIAGFLNYKICRLMFKLKVPRDAINHFVNHIEKYRNCPGHKDVIFEHYAWLSTQHTVFAELFCEAIKNGLPALQTQHPGIYFHKAAEFIMKRKAAFLESSAILPSTGDPAVALSLQNNSSMAFYTEYFGIRAPKTGDSLSEQQMNILILENEKTFNHSAAIIGLLGQAMAQYKIYKCLRFRKKLAVDMAEEYYKSGDHSKALTLYSLMLPDYRSDKWSSIFSDVLRKTMRCALLSASVADYVTCSLESLSLKMNYSAAERVSVLEDLWRIFEGVPLTPQSAPDVRDKWENALIAAKPPILVDLNKVTDLFEMCGSFESVELKNDEAIKLHLIVKLLTDVPLKVTSFAVLLTDGSRTFRLQSNKYRPCADMTELRESHSSSSSSVAYRHYEKYLKMEPGVYYRFLFSTEAQQFLENTQLSVSSIELQMGTTKLWTVLTKSATFTSNTFRPYNRGRDLDDNIAINPMCYIAPTFHLVTQTNLNNEPMLVNEYYPVMTIVSNPHNVFLQNVALHISVPQQLQGKVFLSTDLSVSRQKLHSHIQIDIGDLPMQSSNSVSYYVFSLVEASVSLLQKTAYTVAVVRPKGPPASAIGGGATTAAVDTSPNHSGDNSPDNTGRPPMAILPTHVQIESVDESSVRKTREDTVSIRCGLEFQFVGRFYTLNRRPLTTLYRGENFLYRANMQILADCDLEILETYLICDHNLVQSSHSFKRKKFTNLYRRGERLEDVLVLRSNATLDDWMTVKEFEERSRKDQPQGQLFGRTRRGLNQKTDIGVASSALATVPASVATLSALLKGTTMYKSLLGKIPTTMTIISNSSSPKALTASGKYGIMSSSLALSDEDRLSLSGEIMEFIEKDNTAAAAAKASMGRRSSMASRLVFNKAMDAVQASGHCRGFIKGAISTDDPSPAYPPFGVYCVKWRRHGSKDENESKFIVNGMDIAVPPLNIYCSIEEKLFVKMPMTFKVILNNPTSQVLHLIATLSISNTVNFICSGHKQLDISIFAHGEQQLVYNLYPLSVGWQKLPELTLEYNTQADPSRDDSQNDLLAELVERSIPKKAFVLPPLKQLTK